MNWKKFVLEYLSFSKRDRIAILSLLFILSAVFFLPRLARQPAEKPAGADSVLHQGWSPRERADSHSSAGKGYRKYVDRSYTSAKKLFFFDPNTASDQILADLGFRTKTIGIIRHYLERGGSFKSPDGLKKIYGFSEEEYNRIRPYVKIEGKFQEETKVQNDAGNSSSYYKRESYSPSRKGFSFSPIEINSADSTSWKSLPGIGSKLSLRIIHFREKLGGFYSVEQIGETFGLADSVFRLIRKYLTVDAGRVKKININTADEATLKSHPYINYQVAKLIVSFRKEHGEFETVEDLKKLILIREEIFNKVSPYLIVN